MPEPSAQPLTGITVIDAATIYAGPFAAQLLGDFGADVIKVEHPLGDSLRTHGPQKDGHGLWWKSVGRNKEALTLNLGHPAGQAILRDLATTADVLIENFRPGTLERWGLGYVSLAERNAGLVMLRTTGFGQFGPYAARRGFGTLAESMSGFAAMTGEPDQPPTLPPFGLADGIAGLAGALAVMYALYHRDARGGHGQMIDLAIIEPILMVLGAQATAYRALGVIPKRTGNRSANNAPRNLYRTRDSAWVGVSTSANAIAERVMRLVGHPEVIEEPWFATGAGRAAHSDLLDRMVSDWIAERDLNVVTAEFEAAGAAVAPVYDISQVVEDPQFRALETFVDLPDADLGPLTLQNVLFRMSATPGRVRFPGRRLGQDSDAILRSRLGLSDERIQELRREGVV